MKAGFLFFGIVDIMYLTALLSVIIHTLVDKEKVRMSLYLLLTIQAPNVISFILVLASDTAATRKFYSSLLAVKLGLLSFTIPLLFMYANEEFLVNKICLPDGED